MRPNPTRCVDQSLSLRTIGDTVGHTSVRARATFCDSSATGATSTRCAGQTTSDPSRANTYALLAEAGPILR